MLFYIKNLLIYPKSFYAIILPQTTKYWNKNE